MVGDGERKLYLYPAIWRKSDPLKTGSDPGSGPGIHVWSQRVFAHQELEVERPSVEIPSGIRRACSSLATGVTAETPGVYAVGSDHRGARPGAKDRKETQPDDIP